MIRSIRILEFQYQLDKMLTTLFSFDHDKIKVLIDLVTVMPTEDVHDRGHKYENPI